ncbi:hypothetical protein JHK87_025861 [Glycine soja]|nr:hypothetical protein JHK87_025861 [Glycine soja]
MLRGGGVMTNIYELCDVDLKDFSIQGCLLRSLPGDVIFDNSSGFSFTCDLSDNIAAPWPSSSSSFASMSLCAPGCCAIFSSCSIVAEQNFDIVIMLDFADEAVTTEAITSNNASGEAENSIKDAAGLLDIRVGCILRAWKHDEADSLYVEEVDIGEPEPRIICSGLVKYIPLEHLQGKKVIVLSNLKPRNMRGVKSCGMLMAASDAKHENVELLFPPEEAIPVDWEFFGIPYKIEKTTYPQETSYKQTKKIWELVQPHLKTDASCIAMLGEHVMRSSVGSVACQSLQNANIS